MLLLCMAKIKEIRAREIKDSRENPTVEVELKTDSPSRKASEGQGKGSFVASCPSGKSTGKNEAVALPFSQAIDNINKIISPKLKGANPVEQKELDELMIRLDGTNNKSKLGANAILPVSIAICRAGAAAKKMQLYGYLSELTGAGQPRVPLASFSFVEGGAHVHPVKSDSRNESVSRQTGQFDRASNLDFQEFMVVPSKKSFAENLKLANEVFRDLQKVIIENYGQQTEIGDDGGFAPKISKSEQALFLLKNANGNKGGKIFIDAAASQFYKSGKYFLEGKEFSRQTLLDFYKDLVSRFDIVAIEDPFDHEDWQGFEMIKKELPKVIIVGDDLTTTNIKKIKEAKTKNACNGVVIKPNQIGTVSETIEVSKLARSYDWKTIVGHGAGETMDNFIADLAVGIGADFIKSGSPNQIERMVKYSRLLEIEKELS